MPLPTPDPIKTKRSVWFRSTSVAHHVIVRSKVGFFLGHWSRSRGGSFRCDGDDCAVCLGGQPARAFYYIWIECENKDVKILEIPDRLKDIAEQLFDDPLGGVGTKLCVRKEGKAQNSPLAILITGRMESEELDIWNFIETLGRPRRFETSTQTSPSRSSPEPERIRAM